MSAREHKCMSIVISYIRQSLDHLIHARKHITESIASFNINTWARLFISSNLQAL